MVFAPPYQPRNVLKNEVASVGTPVEACFFQTGGQRRQVKGGLYLRRITLVRIIDEWRVRGDQHQMVGYRLAGDLGEIVIAESKLPRVGKVGGNIRLGVLLVDGAGGTVQPRLVVVGWVEGRRVGRTGQLRVSICAWESSEVIVKSVVLLHDDDHMADQTLGWHGFASFRRRPGCSGSYGAACLSEGSKIMRGRVICQASGFVHMIEKQRRGAAFRERELQRLGALVLQM